MGGVMKKILLFKRGKAGFTLLEVMIALSILAIGILGVSGMFISSIGGNAQGRNMTVATSIGQSKLDLLSNAVIYEGLVSGSETSGKYNVFWNVTTPVAALEMKSIKVTVTWEVKGETHTVQLNTLRAKS
jgi:prepilin-type N-terminal cleavage/methylation domain-containing protein